MNIAGDERVDTTNGAVHDIVSRRHDLSWARGNHTTSSTVVGQIAVEVLVRW